MTVARTSLDNHLLELTDARDTFTMLGLGNDKRNFPFFRNFPDRGLGRFLRSRFYLDGDGLSFTEVVSRRRTCSANQGSKDEESLYCSACDEGIHEVFCQ